MNNCYFRLSLIFFTAATALNCAQMFPGEVASGVARLSVQNFGAIVQIISSDKNCGFSAPHIKDNPVLEGEVGRSGQGTWRVEGCEINLNQYEVFTACDGTPTYASGKLVVSAKQIIQGRLTGDIENPVVPQADNAATIIIEEARFEEFKVAAEGDANILTMNHGSISGKMVPRLAMDTENGVCAVITPVAYFEDLTYKDAKVSVDTDGFDFSADVNESKFWAQNGADGEQENALGGTLTVWGNQQQVPTDDDGLNPEYKRNGFMRDLECIDNIALPVSHECSLDHQLALGTARLTMKTLANIMSALYDDSACGFGSTGVKSSVITTGTVGDAQGSALYQVNDCVLNYPEPITIATDCAGNATTIQGQATISASQLLQGILTGDPDEPVVPTTWEPAEISLSADLQNLTVLTENFDSSLFIHQGTLAGSVMPRTAIDTELGACSKITPVAKLRNVSLNNADVTIYNGATQFRASIESSTIDGVNGSNGEAINQLSGSVTIDGQQTDLGIQPLDPDYDPLSFEESYLCDADIMPATESADCDMTDVLAMNAARLLVQNFGAAVIATEDNASCGFSKPSNMIPSGLDPTDTEEVTVSWEIENCEIGSDTLKEYTWNCHGNKSYIIGSAEVDMIKTATGNLAIGYPPLEPSSPSASSFELLEARFKDFAAVSYDENSDEPQPYLLIKEATMSGISYPVTGESASKPGVFFIATPLAGFERIAISDTEAVIVAGKKQFNVRIGGSDLSGFNGSYQGRTNELAGHITVGGRTHAIPTQNDNRGLNPEFEQQTFNEGYLCYDDLAGLLPSN